MPSPMLRPLFTRSWAGLPVRCDRPPLPAQAHPVRAGRMIPRSLPAVPALSPMGLARAFHPHGPSPQTHGAAIELRPAGSPGGADQGWTNVSPAIRLAAAGEPDVIADQASDWLFSQTIVEITPTTLCENRAEKSAPVLLPATRNILDFVRHCRFSWNHVWTSQRYADQSLDRRDRTSRLAASRRAK